MTTDHPPGSGPDANPASAASIRVRDLSKTFSSNAGGESVFSGLSFDIGAGSFVTLIGRSGSGKSTLLNVISGIEEPSAGEVQFGEVDDVVVGHVFQSPRLLPWNTCVQNIEYVHEHNPDFTPVLAKQYLDMVGLSEHYHKYPNQLSGGQRQRVGIARALSIDPHVLLMDEPFSNLDEITAESLREELIRIWQDLNKTVLFVTHDITEAIQLADRILMLGNGELFSDLAVPLDRPREIDSDAFITFRAEAIDVFNRQGEG